MMVVLKGVVPVHSLWPLVNFGWWCWLKFWSLLNRLSWSLSNRLLDEVLFSVYGTFLKITLDRVGHVVFATVSTFMFFFESPLAVPGYMVFSTVYVLWAYMTV